MATLFLFYSLLSFFFLNQSFSSSSVLHLCFPGEAFALLQFKQPFQISDHHRCHDDELRHLDFPKTTSWNESKDCCSWDGVTCDLLTGHVIGLDLSCSQLHGNIHPNSSLFQLHHLQTLNLANNNFNFSSIPNGIGRLRNLRHLNLSLSKFHGKIPREISYLSNLVSLDLSHFSHDSELRLDQETFELLLQNFTNLEVVSLSGVNISSPIPINLSSSLRHVDLRYTNLQGVLTESLFLLPNLESLSLHSNYLLTGVLPKFYPGNTLLKLDISNTGISGELPDSIGNLTRIRKLDLRGNNFTGQIPSTISKLTQLTYLDLSYNSLGGNIPNVFSNLQELRILYLSENSFTGPFPTSILSLRNLRILTLFGNSVSGPLPNSCYSFAYI